MQATLEAWVRSNSCATVFCGGHLLARKLTTGYTDLSRRVKAFLLSCRTFRFLQLPQKALHKVALVRVQHWRILPVSAIKWPRTENIFVAVHSGPKHCSSQAPRGSMNSLLDGLMGKFHLSRKYDSKFSIHMLVRCWVRPIQYILSIHVWRHTTCEPSGSAVRKPNLCRLGGIWCMACKTGHLAQALAVLDPVTVALHLPVITQVVLMAPK